MNSTIVFLVTLLLTILIIIATKRLMTHKKSTFLILGTSLTGKTRLFNRFIGNDVRSLSSLEESVYQNDLIKVIDVPGHEKLRFIWKKYSKDASAQVLFLVGQADIVDVYYLKEVLFCGIKRVVVLYTQQDYTSYLEREIQKLESDFKFDELECEVGFQTIDLNTISKDQVNKLFGL